MKKFFGNKLVLILLAVLVIGGGVGAFVLYSGGSEKQQDPTAPKVNKIDTVFGYLGSESNYSKFNGLVGMFDSAKYLAKNEANLEPSLVVFAPNNEAFNKEDMKPFDSLAVAAKDQIKLYHMAAVFPENATTAANLELTDGRKIKTLLGRELIVINKDGAIKITDGKGRDASVSRDYALSNKGDRIYFIDNMLLFQ